MSDFDYFVSKRIVCLSAGKLLPTVSLKALCFHAAFVVDTWKQRNNHNWIQFFAVYLLLNSCRPTYVHCWDSLWGPARPVCCMMTLQFAKLQASWNPVLKKPQTLPELLIKYWWGPNKCTRLTVPMTFLLSLSHFCCSVCLYVSVNVLIWITKDNCFQQYIGLQISTVPLSLLPGNSNKHTSMPDNYSFTLCDSPQSSPSLLASHQSLLMCSHKGNQHADLIGVYKHQQRITGIILITSLPLGINIKSI